MGSEVPTAPACQLWSLPPIRRNQVLLRAQKQAKMGTVSLASQRSADDQPPDPC